jgi:hypothetical protein
MNDPICQRQTQASMSDSNTRLTASICGRITLAFVAVLAKITKRHGLHVVDHVGMFAGSLLQRGDWDHK